MIIVIVGAEHLDWKFLEWFERKGHNQLVPCVPTYPSLEILESPNLLCDRKCCPKSFQGHRSASRAHPWGGRRGDDLDEREICRESESIRNSVQQISMDWFKGKSTGNHGFLPLDMGVSCKFSLKPIHWKSDAQISPTWLNPAVVVPIRRKFFESRSHIRW